MIELQIAPEQHFDQIEYAGSELLIFKYNPNQSQLLLCCNDLSEKIPEWVSGKKKVGYTFRYKIFGFYDVFDFQRSGVNIDTYANAQNDFFIHRDNLTILIDEINIQQEQNDFKAFIAFERGFGVAEFTCKQITLHEIPFYFSDRRAEKNYYYVDPTTKADFSEVELLVHLYEG